MVKFMKSYAKDTSKAHYTKLFKRFFGKNQKNKFSEFVSYLEKR